MGVVLLQILQWILRIILFLLLLLLGLIMIVLIVPIRYQVEGKFQEKKPEGRGKITWFFYLIYMSFVYEEDFHIQVRVFGFKVFDSANKSIKPKSKKKSEEENVVEEANANGEEVEEIFLQGHEGVAQDEDSEKTLKMRSEGKVLLENKIGKKQEPDDELAVLEKEIETEAKKETGLAGKITRSKTYSSKQVKQAVSQDAEQKQVVSQDIEKKQGEFQDAGHSQNVSQDIEENTPEKEKKSLSEKIKDIKLKIQGIIQKIKDIIAKIKEGKLKAEHYLELWNRKETQITFSRAKTKLGRMVKAVLPRKWKVTGELGFDNPATTGQIMGALGAMYPILGNKVQIVPNFENEVINIEGSMKGHIRLGNLLYQLVSLILNRHCFKFIKLILDELGSSKKSKKGDIDNGRK